MFPISCIMQLFSLPLHSSLRSLYSSLSVSPLLSLLQFYSSLSVSPFFSLLLSPLTLLLSVCLTTSTPLCLSRHSSFYSSLSVLPLFPVLHSLYSLSLCPPPLLSLSPLHSRHTSPFLTTPPSPLAVNNSGCSNNNGECEQFCFTVPNVENTMAVSTSYKCACHTGYKLNNDNSSCLNSKRYKQTRLTKKVNRQTYRQIDRLIVYRWIDRWTKKVNK